MFRRISLAIAGLLVIVALSSQQGHLLPARAASPGSGVETSLDLFADVTVQAGLVKNGILHNRVPGAEKSIGQAWGDYDNDGWVDLYVTDPLGPNTLYHNNGDGTFSVSPLVDQVDLPLAYSNGASFADYDNDGWRDLYVANWGANVLFRNVNGTAFVDVTAEAGVGDTSNGQTASWGDYDNDGFLDLYVANWSCFPDCGRPSMGDLDVLYHNKGDGTFTQVTKLLKSGYTGAGFVASFTDYDNDGDLDIYLVNDEFINPIGNKLWRNDGPGCDGWCFSEVSKTAGVNSFLFGMGLAVGDYDNDGDQDFYFTNVGPMELQQNQGDGTFKEVADAAGVRQPKKIGWGAVFFDYDNDGWHDLYVAVMERTDVDDIASNSLYHNNSDGTFSLVPCRVGVSDVRASMGVAYADFDHDGWVDLVVGNADEGYRLYRNQAGFVLSPADRGQWLSIELAGAGQVNRDAVGARVYVTTPDGLTQMQEVINGSSLGGGNELTLSFGLGENARADIRVRWPDGVEQTFTSLSANQRYHLNYPLNQPTSPTVLPGQSASSWKTDTQSRPLDILALIGGLLAALGVGLLAVRAAGAALFSQDRLVGVGILGAGVLLFTLASSLVAGLSLTTSPASSATELNQLMESAGVRKLTNPTFSPALVRLGEALFWDPELSGNRDISCATCHHSLFATGDGLSVSVGTSGRGLGDERVLGGRLKFIPRNAPPVFNLGYTEWNVLFWDGRVSGDVAAGFNTPASDRLPDGLNSLLAAQAMFPVTSREEMRGEIGDKDIFGNHNELAGIKDWNVPAIWQAIMKRLLVIPAYQELFLTAYPDMPQENLGFEHAANALAAYQAVVFTFEDSPFDRYLAGDVTAFSEEQRRGAVLFYGKAGCADCHSGGLLTDQRFHNIGVPLVGHGKGRERPLDLGRARETGSDCDRYAFRTPPLRNVALTGPWMHNGAFATLEGAVRHHFERANGLLHYDPSQLAPEMETTCIEEPDIINAVLATLEDNSSQDALTDAEFQDVIAFLNALTSPTAQDLHHTIPTSVPSGLTVGGN